MLKKLLACSAAVLLSFTLSAPASAAYPGKEAKLVIPYQPGGATDIIYRVTSSAAEATFGKSIVPVNMGGAGGVKGARFVKDSKADGYTVLAGHDFLFTTFYGRLSDFPYTVFEPVCLLTQTPNILVARAGLPFKTVKEMGEYAKKNPGKLSITYSPASTGSLFFDQLLKLANIDRKLFRIVTINGTGPQVRALLGGHVDLAMGNVPSSLSYSKEGKLTMIAVSSEKRLGACPDVPTLREQGIDFVYANNRGVFVPKGTPKEAIDKLAAAYKASLVSKDTQKKIYDLGSVPAYMDPKAFSDFLAGQDKLYKASFAK